MKKLTSMTLTATMCAVMGFASIGIANDTSSYQGSENNDKTIIETPLNQLQRGEESSVQSLDNTQQVPVESIKSHSEFIMGTVTLVGDNMIKILDGESGMSREIKVSQKQEEALSSGYMIDAEIRDGKLVAFSTLGIPDNVEDIVYSSENLPKEGMKIQMPPTWEPQS